MDDAKDDVARTRLTGGVPARLIVLLLVAVVVLPGIAFAGLLLQRYAQSETSRFEQEAQNVARASASVLDRHLRGWQTTLETLATSENLIASNLEAFYRQALRVKSLIGADIGLRDLDGQQLINTRLPFGSILPKTPMPIDGEVIATSDTLVSNVFKGAVADRPLVALIATVRVEGAPRYLIHISAETSILRDVIGAVVPPNWFVAIGDRNGVFVARSQDHERFTGTPGIPAFLSKAVGDNGTFAAKSALGDDVLVGYVRSTSSGWLIAANIRQSIVEQPLRSALWTFAAFGMLALLLTSALALWLWRLVDRPLAALTAASSRLGSFDGPIVTKTKLREFVALRDAMSRASIQLRDDTRQLEARVEARTEELAQANATLTAEIAERTRIEAKLTQAQKMEAIGNLTGGVAHDFNNLLQVVSGNLELLLRDVGENEKAARRIRNAMDGVSRGSKLSGQLLAFGRRQPLAPEVMNVGRLLRGMDEMLRRTLGEEVEVETLLGGGLWNTLIDPSNLENAILNLAINARDAMNGQGHLTIEAGNAFLDDAYVLGHSDVTPGQYVQISVTDTGAGMSEATANQAFEPFFSTKPEGKGSGLGLSMVYGFVKQSGGHVKIYSEPGHGTTIKLYLPRSTQLEGAVRAQDNGPVVGGNETILVVEDDDAVRETVISLLGELGYHVLRASDAQKALALLEAGVSVDLLFTDVVMPGILKSPELARRGKALLPALSVLFTSGYTENSIVHGGRLDEGVNLLSKPYTREALARKIRQVLAQDGKEAGVINSEKSEPAEKGKMDEGALTVLVCEDDAIIRMNTVDMLQDLGYLTVEAGDGRQALVVLQDREIDILMTDVGLPDILGTSLALEARAAKPTLAVIFATGRDRVEGFDNVERIALLKKPFLLASLETALRSVS